MHLQLQLLFDQFDLLVLAFLQQFPSHLLLLESFLELGDVLVDEFDAGVLLGLGRPELVLQRPESALLAGPVRAEGVLALQMHLAQPLLQTRYLSLGRRVRLALSTLPVGCLQRREVLHIIYHNLFIYLFVSI